MRCEQCGAETFMPFKCPYCNQRFCVEHRLPENHECPEYWRARAPKKQPVKPQEARVEPSYRYTVTMAPPKRGKVIWFSVTELKHLLAGALLTLAIGFSMGFSPLYSGIPFYQDLPFLTSLAVVFTLSFMIHELAHKFSAQQHGLWAEFRITMFGALITLLSVISPFKIISPGAVMVSGAADRETIGKTSIAGPLTNIVLALLFLALTSVTRDHVILYGMLINSFIALFNLIPFGVLDGFKVFFWSKTAWAVTFSASLLLTVYSYTVF